jgi:predicted DNA-binding transcriptional regulator YafY
MSAPPSYVQRFVRVARALAILPGYPDGIRLSELAALLDATEDEVRDEIRAYHVADVPIDQLGGGYHEPVIEFVAGPDPVADHDDEVSPAEAPYVRLRDVRPTSGVGTRLLSFGQLAAVAAAAYRLLAQEPENEVLAAALDAVTGSVLGETGPGDPPWPTGVVHRLKLAAAERRRVRIAYSMAWKAGVVERVIEPYRVVHTGRGWEVDAAVVGRAGAVATFLATGILSHQLLPERFERPPDVYRLVERHRRARPVTLAVPHAARWVIEMHTESAEPISEDENLLRVRAFVPPPVGPRLGLVLLLSGPEAFVIDPADHRDAGRELAQALLAHHGRA